MLVRQETPQFSNRPLVSATVMSKTFQSSLKVSQFFGIFDLVTQKFMCYHLGQLKKNI